MTDHRTPMDFIVPDRVDAAKERRCVAPPIGCGQPITGFRNEVSAREYELSRWCQNCQDRFFGKEE